MFWANKKRIAELEERIRRLEDALKGDRVVVEILKKEFPCESMKKRQCTHCREHCRYANGYEPKDPDEFIDDFIMNL